MYQVWAQGKHQANLYVLRGGTQFFLSPCACRLQHQYFYGDFEEMKRILRRIFGNGTLKYYDPKDILAKVRRREAVNAPQNT